MLLFQLHQKVDMSFITSIVNIEDKKVLCLKKSDSSKIYGCAIKRSFPYTQKSVVVQDRQGKPNNLVGETNTALAKRSTKMNLSVCMSVRLYLRQLWKSEDPEPTHAWTVCEVPDPEWLCLCLFVLYCVGTMGSVPDTVEGLQHKGTVHIPAAGETGKQEQLLGRPSV